MKLLMVMMMAWLPLLTGCTPAQRANCGFCRFVDGPPTWPAPPDANSQGVRP
jgi:hypothetical protein